MVTAEAIIPVDFVHSEDVTRRATNRVGSVGPPLNDSYSVGNLGVVFSVWGHMASPIPRASALTNYEEQSARSGQAHAILLTSRSNTSAKIEG